MNIKDYDKLRKKINVKDFEGKNKGLNKWLFIFSYFGNIGSIFFAYFLVYPALFKAISINLVNGFWGTILAFIFSNILLIAFEIIKRYLIKNFSFDFVKNNKKINPASFGWLIISITIILLSFFLSIVGSKNLATTSIIKNNVAEISLNTEKDSLSNLYENKKKIYENDNNTLRQANTNLRNKLIETPVEYRVVRNDYQKNINNNTEALEKNQNEINKIDEQLKQKIDELKSKLIVNKIDYNKEDTKNITLFVIIAMFCESIIIFGVYFREFFVYNLFIINQQKFEKLYLKRDRYRSLLTFIYNNGKITIGDKVMSGLELKEIVAEKTLITNSNKFVDDFLTEMNRLSVFNTQGKRRYIVVNFDEALKIVEKIDDATQILENMR